MTIGTIAIIYGVTLLIILAFNYSVGKTNKDIDEDARINLEKEKPVNGITDGYQIKSAGIG